MPKTINLLVLQNLSKKMFNFIQEENLNIGSDRIVAIPGSSEVKFPKNISDKFHSLRFHTKRHNSSSSLYSNLILENTKEREKIIENDDQNKPIIPLFLLSLRKSQISFRKITMLFLQKALWWKIGSKKFMALLANYCSRRSFYENWETQRYIDDRNGSNDSIIV